MTAFAHATIVLVGAVAVDVLLGEPPNALHPVVWMGTLQRALRRLAPRRALGAFVHGSMMALLGPALFGGGSWLVLRALAPRPWIQVAVEIFLLKSAFAARGLGRAAKEVAVKLGGGDLAAARHALRSLVSRDTSKLDASLLAAAAIESVAENTSDSVVAPLLYFVIWGVPGALAYRAINTLDAMIGYHGETEWLGKAAARLDDVANLVPARLTAAVLVLASIGASASPARALRTWWRDGDATESPNAGRPMAAMAGALDVRLEKVGHYRLGDGAAARAHDIDRSIYIFVRACAITVSLVVVACWLRTHAT